MNKIAYPLTPTFIDYPDDESEAIVIYLMGCDNNCKECHNPDFKDFNNEINTRNFTALNLVDLVIEEATKIKTNKVVISGGDPLYDKNIEFTKELLSYLYILGFKTIVYTGKEIDYVKSILDFKYFTFVKCGKYKEELKTIPEKTDDYLRFSSSNQELYDENLVKISENGIYYFRR